MARHPHRPRHPRALMPSTLPRLNLVMTAEMRRWLDDQRQPCESASHVVRRLILHAMQAEQASRPGP
jgi:hypothetical protein